MERQRHELIYQLGDAHYEFLSLWPGAVQRKTNAATLVGNGLTPIPFRNHATFVRVQPEQIASLIAEVQAFYSALGAIPAFQLDPQTEPADFTEYLSRAGYRQQAEEAWMVFDRDHAGQEAANPAVQVERLDARSGEDAIQAYVDCYTLNFRTPPPAVAGFGESFRGVLSQPAAIHYLARVEGEVAGALSLFFKDGFGCVYNVGTFQSFRGRGIATTLLLQLVDDAAHLGVHILFLQALHHGPAQPLYQRVGFRTRFVRPWYLPDAPGGIWSPATQV